MKPLPSPAGWQRWLAGVAFVLAAWAAGGWPPPARADAEALQARHASLREALRDNPYGRAMHVASTETGQALQGDVHAVLDHPFGKVRQALAQPAAWCDVLLLPFNTKYCHAVDRPGEQRLHLRVGRKHDQPAEQAYPLDFAFRNVADTDGYFETRLSADQGPLGTRDYRVRIAAIPLPDGRTFMHLRYAYGYGAMGRLAMQAYLATAGADKVGFSVTGRDADGAPQYIGGVRGAVERNAMRYYLAVDAFLATLAAPPAQQVERRIHAWFSATQRYPRQLHEMDRATYAAMKRQEYARMETAVLQ